MGEWTGDGYEYAKKLIRDCPAEFYRLVGWADADAEAEPIQMQVARAKAKSQEKHKGAANNSISKRRPVPSRTSPDYDPADDPGDALVSTD